MKKKKIIIIALLVALLGAAAGFFLVKRGGIENIIGAGRNFPKPVEEYTVGTETVPSITASIPEGKDEILLSMAGSEPTEEEKKAMEEESELSAEEQAEKEALEQEAADQKLKDEEEQKWKEEIKDLDEDEIKELEKERKKEEKRKQKEEKKREKAEKKAQKKREKEEKKRQKESGETEKTAKKKPVTENLEAWNKYYYQSNPHTIRVLKTYAAYLEEEGFTQVEGEKEAAKPKAPNQEAQNQGAEAAQPSTFYGKYQKESEDEGYLFSIELQYPLADDPAIQMYEVKAIKEKAPMQGDALQSQGMTRDRALSYLESLDSATLGLEKPLTDYYVVMDMGRSYVEGKDCYGINVYERGNTKESYFVQKYYMSINDQELYSCDIDGIIRRLHPSGATAPESLGEGAVQTQGTSSTEVQTNTTNTTNTEGATHDWKFGSPDEKQE